MDQIEYSGRDNLEVMQEAKHYNRFLLDLIISKACAGDLLVDFGAGNGTFAQPVTAAGHRVICVETDPILSSTLKNYGLDVVNNLDLLEDGSIDYLYSLNVLEHIEDDESVARLWLRKLRPGGQLLVYVPAFQFLYTSMDQKVGHMRRYNRRMLIDRLIQAGFEVRMARYADSIGVLATLVYKLLDKGFGDVNLGMLKVYDRWVFPLSKTLDFVLCHFVGKNVYARAKKPVESK